MFLGITTRRQRALAEVHALAMESGATWTRATLTRHGAERFRELATADLLAVLAAGNAEAEAA